MACDDVSNDDVEDDDAANDDVAHVMTWRVAGSLLSQLTQRTTRLVRTLGSS